MVFKSFKAETFAKHPFLPNFYACPVECEAYSSGVGPADRTGVVKILPFLELEPRLNNNNRFNWAGKNEYFFKGLKADNFCVERETRFELATSSLEG